eukprot:g4372.t1
MPTHARSCLFFVSFALGAFLASLAANYFWHSVLVDLQAQLDTARRGTGEARAAATKLEARLTTELLGSSKSSRLLDELRKELTVCDENAVASEKQLATRDAAAKAAERDKRSLLVRHDEALSQARQRLREATEELKAVAAREARRLTAPAKAGDDSNDKDKVIGPWAGMADRVAIAVKTGAGTFRQRVPVQAAAWLHRVRRLSFMSDADALPTLESGGDAGATEGGDAFSSWLAKHRNVNAYK